jgi:hypothetical protein
MKKIAIRGGIDTIKLLESLGGTNAEDYEGRSCNYYYLNENKCIKHSSRVPKGYIEIKSSEELQQYLTINYTDI